MKEGPSGGTKMKRDSDFWFWVATMVVLLAAAVMWLAQQLNFFSQFFMVLFFVVAALVAGYMGVSIVLDHQKEPVTPPAVTVGQPQDAPGRHTWRRTLGGVSRFGAFASLMAILWLPKDSKDSTPLQWALIGLGGALFAVWLWYELVGSKAEEVGG